MNTNAKSLKSLETLLDGQELLAMDGYDDCIVGIVEQYGRPPVICYSKAKVIAKLMEESDMTEDEALEFWSFNQIGAYVGEETPCFLTLPPPQAPSMNLQVGRVYRAKKPKGCGFIDQLCDDRLIKYIGPRGEVQYDSPSVKTGKRYPVVTREKFIAWAARDVTDELPKGEWAEYPLKPAPPSLGDRVKSVLVLIGNVDHSKGNGPNSAKLRGDLLNDIRTILQP